mgnify:CR=1 FL=1
MKLFKKMTLFHKIMICFVLGIVVGIIMGPKASVFEFLGTIMIRLLEMVVAPLILCLMISTVGSVSDMKSFGGIAVKTVITYACLTFIAVALGLGALLATSEFWFGIVKWAGACYLAFLGIVLLRSRGTLDSAMQPADTGEATSASSIFLKSFLVAATNPKGYLFFSAFLPQFIDALAPQVPQYTALALVFAGIDFIVMFAYALLGAQAVRMLRQSGALWLDRICGDALLVLAASLALYRRASA